MVRQNDEYEDESASSTIFLDSCRSVRNSLSLGFKSMVKRLRELLSDIAVVLKYPLLLAAFSIEIGAGLFTCISLALLNKLAIIALIALQAPVIYLIVREAWRQMHSLPPSESWETSPEKWNAALSEYITAQKKAKAR